MTQEVNASDQITMDALMETTKLFLLVSGGHARVLLSIVERKIHQR